MKKSKQAIMTRFLMIAFLCASSGCFFFNKSKIRSQEKSPQEIRLDQVLEKINAIREQYPSEFHGILNQVSTRMQELILHPEEAKNKPALVFFLNSLPGGGKSTFIEKLKVAIDAYYAPTTISPENFKYLDFTPIVSLAAEEGDFIRKEVKPAILFFDEYQNAISFVPPEKADGYETTQLEQLTEMQSQSNQAVQMINGLLTQKDAEEFKGIITQISADLQTQNTNLQNMIRIINDQKSNYEKNKTGYEEWYKQAKRQFDIFWGALGGGQVRSEVSENISTAAGEFNKALQKLAVLKSDVSRSLLVQADLFDRVEKKRAELRVVFNEQSPETRKKYEDAANKDREPKAKPGDSVDAQNDALKLGRDDYEDDYKPLFGGGLGFGSDWAFEKFLNDNDEYKSLKKQTEDAVKDVQNARDKLQKYLNEEFENAINYFVDTAPETARQMISKIDWSDDQWKMRLFEFMELSAGSEKTETRLALERKFIDELNSSGTKPKMLWLGKVAVGFLSQEIQRLIDNPLGNNQKSQYAANLMVFFAGNIIPIQNALHTVLVPELAKESREFKNLKSIDEYCDQVVENQKASLKLSQYRDPDCIRRIVTEIAESPEGQKAIETAIKAPFGNFVKRGGVDEGTYARPENTQALNEGAFLSRLQLNKELDGQGGFPFMPPPDSTSFRKFIERELSRLSRDFEELIASGGTADDLSNLSSRFSQQKNDPNVKSAFKPTVTLEFDPELINAFYRKYVNGSWGFRWLSDKSANILDSPITSYVKNDVRERIGAAIADATRCTTEKPFTAAARAAQSASDGEAVVSNNAIDSVPDKVIVRFDAQTGELRFDYARSYPDSKTQAAPGVFDSPIKFTSEELMNVKGRAVKYMSRDRYREVAAFLTGEFFLGPLLFGSYSEEQLEIRFKEANEGPQLSSSFRPAAGWDTVRNNINWNFTFLMNMAAGEAGYNMILGGNQYLASQEVTARAMQFIKASRDFYRWLIDGVTRNMRDSEPNVFENVLNVPISLLEPQRSLLESKVIQLLLPELKTGLEVYVKTKKIPELPMSVSKQMYRAAVEQLQSKFRGNGKVLIGPLVQGYEFLLAELRKTEKQQVMLNMGQLAHIFSSIDLNGLSLTDRKIVEGLDSIVAGQFAAPVCNAIVADTVRKKLEIIDNSAEEERLRKLLEAQSQEFMQEALANIRRRQRIASTIMWAEPLVPVAMAALYKYGYLLPPVMQEFLR